MDPLASLQEKALHLRESDKSGIKIEQTRRAKTKERENSGKSEVREQIQDPTKK